MGNCRSVERPYHPPNRCSDSYETIELPHFCSLIGSYDSIRDQYCRKMSTEWEFAGESNYCAYDSGEDIPVTDFGSGCDGCGSCGILGKGTYCKRKSFNGDPLTCCFIDYKCSRASGQDTCFDLTSRKATCHPDYRSMTSTKCRDRILNWCQGNDLPNTSSNRNKWLGRWTSNNIFPENYPVPSEARKIDSPCYKAIWRNLYDGEAFACSMEPFENQVIVPNAEGYAWTRQLFEGMLNKYFAYGGSLLDNDPGKLPDTELNAKIYTLCKKFPGICESGLKKYCSTVTADTLKRKPSLSKWCGCYMADEQYAKYTDLYQIDKECTPTCNVDGVVPLSSTLGLGTKTCEQSFCMMDDISLAIVKSRVGTGSGITFSQVCPSCGAASTGAACRCKIANLTMAILDSEIPSLNISQQCGVESTCYQEKTNTDGTLSTERVACNTSDPFADVGTTSQNNYQSAITRRNVWIIILIILALVAIVVLWLIFRPTRIPKPSPPLIMPEMPPSFVSQPFVSEAPETFVSQPFVSEAPQPFVSQTFIPEAPQPVEQFV